MAINLVVFGFNIRVVNVYSPTDCEPNNTIKDTFYRELSKASKVQQKHQKLLVIGDFNATTSLAYKNCCFDGSNFMPDNDCNNNGSRLKAFCRSKNLSISSTYFNYPSQQRYTWYSPDGITKKVNDYVLSEKFIQQYMTDCVVDPI